LLWLQKFQSGISRTALCQVDCASSGLSTFNALRGQLEIWTPVKRSPRSIQLMDTDMRKNSQPLGLELLSGMDGFINDLDPEAEASISGGRRGWRERARRSRLRTLRSRRRSRRNNPASLRRSRLSRLRSLRNPFD
jgi:hypothetical protein